MGSEGGSDVTEKRCAAFEIGRASTTQRTVDHITCCQLNVGMISGGEWSGSVAERCSICADVGFLPSTSILDLKRQVEQACRSISSREKAQSLTVHTNVGLRNDAYLTDATEPVVTNLMAAVSRHSLQPEATSRLARQLRCAHLSEGRRSPQGDLRQWCTGRCTFPT